MSENACVHGIKDIARSLSKFPLSNLSVGIKQGSYWDKRNKAVKEASLHWGREQYIQTCNMKAGTHYWRDYALERWLQALSDLVRESREAELSGRSRCEQTRRSAGLLSFLDTVKGCFVCLFVYSSY